MRIDLWVPTANPFATAEVLSTVGAEADQRGVGTLWVGEHVVLFDEYGSAYPYAESGKIPVPPNSGLLEPLSTLSFLAAATERVRLGTAMVLLPQRNPVYTAKEVATLDWLSNGRVDFGVGVGWLAEEFARPQRPLAAPRAAVRRVPRRALDALVRRDLLVLGRVLRPAGLLDVPEAGPGAAPTRPYRRRERRRAQTRRRPGPRAGTPSTGRPMSSRTRSRSSMRLLAERGRARSDITVTVCPYFQPLDADILEGYAEAGVDAVAAMLLPLSTDDVKSGLDALDPVFERATRL